MMFARKTKKMKLAIAAAVLGLGAMAFSAPAGARGFSSFHGGMGGFRGGMGGFHGGMGGFHGGGMMRGVGRFTGPVAFAHPRSAGSAFFARRAFANRPLFFDRRFVDHRRFAGPFAAGFIGAAYGASGYDDSYYDSGDYGNECFVVRRHFVNSWGYLVVRRTLVCS